MAPGRKTGFTTEQWGWGWRNRIIVHLGPTVDGDVGQKVDDVGRHLVHSVVGG